MPAYRDHAPRPELHLVPGAQPHWRVAVKVASGFAIVTAGSWLGAAALRNVDVWSNGQRVFLGGLALLFVTAGLYTLWSAWAAATTRVRLVLDGSDVVLEWRRRGRTLRTESVPRAAVNEVALLYRRDDDGQAWYKLVLRTARGDLAFAREESPVQARLAHERRTVEKFLGLAPTRDAGD